jgi:hypothetical protein
VQKLRRQPLGAPRLVQLALPVSLLSVALGGFCFTRIGQAQSADRSPGRPTSSWSAGNRITLKVASRDEPGSVTYGFLMAANGDMQIDIDEHAASQRSSGTSR